MFSTARLPNSKPIFNNREISLAIRKEETDIFEFSESELSSTCKIIKSVEK
jgi:hypothetical protein